MIPPQEALRAWIPRALHVPGTHCPWQPLPHRGFWFVIRVKEEGDGGHRSECAHGIPPQSGPHCRYSPSPCWAQLSELDCLSSSPGGRANGEQNCGFYLSYESIKVNGKCSFAVLIGFKGLDNIRRKCRSKKLSCCLHPDPYPPQITPSSTSHQGALPSPR